eukprot:IDg9336t1
MASRQDVASVSAKKSQKSSPRSIKKKARVKDKIRDVEGRKNERKSSKRKSKKKSSSKLTESMSNAIQTTSAIVNRAAVLALKAVPESTSLLYPSLVASQRPASQKKLAAAAAPQSTRPDATRREVRAMPKSVGAVQLSAKEMLQIRIPHMADMVLRNLESFSHSMSTLLSARDELLGPVAGLTTESERLLKQSKEEVSEGSTDEISAFESAEDSDQDFEPSSARKVKWEPVRHSPDEPLSQLRRKQSPAYMDATKREFRSGAIQGPPLHDARTVSTTSSDIYQGLCHATRAPARTALALLTAREDSGSIRAITSTNLRILPWRDALHALKEDYESIIPYKAHHPT